MVDDAFVAVHSTLIPFGVHGVEVLDIISRSSSNHFGDLLHGSGDQSRACVSEQRAFPGIITSDDIEGHVVVERATGFDAAIVSFGNKVAAAGPI